MLALLEQRQGASVAETCAWQEFSSLTVKTQTYTYNNGRWDSLRPSCACLFPAAVLQWK